MFAIEVVSCTDNIFVELMKIWYKSHFKKVIMITKDNKDKKDDKDNKKSKTVEDNINKYKFINYVINK